MVASRAESFNADWSRLVAQLIVVVGGFLLVLRYKNIEQKSRILFFGVKILAVCYFLLSLSTHVRDGRADRQTGRNSHILILQSYEETRNTFCETCICPMLFTSHTIC